MYPINFGSHRLKFGIYVTSISTIKIAAKYTSNCLNTVSICTLPTLTPTNSVVPTGGVIVPIHRLKIIMIPKWIVVIPSAVHTGRKIGVKIRPVSYTHLDVYKRQPLFFQNFLHIRQFWSCLHKNLISRKLQRLFDIIVRWNNMKLLGSCLLYTSRCV